MHGWATATLVGGFGLVGAPLALLDALAEISEARDLTVVSNNIGEPGRGLGKLLRQGLIRRGISSYFTSNPEAVEAVHRGEIEATLLPQGTFAEAIRAAGAGIGGFYTPVGAGTLLAEGKEERVIDGVAHVLERPIRGDVALVYAARGDSLGNLWYRRTARNFNPLMATAADLVIAEVGEPRARGSHRAGGRPHAAPVRRPPGSRLLTSDPKTLIAARAARELRPGEVVNLGIGIPNLIPGLLDRERGVVIQTENGLLGVGLAGGRRGRCRRHRRSEASGDRAARGRVLRQRVLVRDDPRRSRGRGCARRDAGRLSGDIANWAVPGRSVLGVGGRWTSWSARSASL